MLTLLSFAFILSGAAGLIYETVWTRYLSLFVGHSAYAQIIVLVIFLGGMAIGSLVVSARSARLHHPLYWYAGVELAVGALGALFHPAFVATTNAAYDHLFPAIPVGTAQTIVKWTVAAALILPQSILLGATFPLMTAGAVRLRGGRAGQVVGLLYFANSLGAAMGVLVEGFVLIAAVGLPGTLITAAALNAIVAVFVVVLARLPVAMVQRLERDASTPADAADASRPASLPAGRLWRVLLGVSFGTALSSFIYEIGWVRMLSLVLGSATHSFELMLSAFILGLALGAFWIRRRIDRDATPLRTIAIVQWAMGMLAIATFPIYLASFGWTAALLDTFKPTSAGYVGFSVAKYATALAVMLPATFCAGMTLPLITRALYVAGAGERAIGVVYSVNTIGSIVGAAIAGLVLLPVIGLKWMLITGASIDIAIGIALFAWDRRFRAPAPRPLGASRARSLAPGFSLIGPIVITGGIVCAIAILCTFDHNRMASGVYRYGAVPDQGTFQFLFYRDGRTASVSVRSLAGDTNSLMTLATNGKPDASIYPIWRRPIRLDDKPIQLQDDMGTQVLLPTVALAHAPRAATVAVIGEGSGMTSHLLLGSPYIRHLYTVEIEPQMIHASHVFYPANRRVFDDPRSSFVLDDARAFLSSSGTRFDLILSEPSNPWVSGVSGLFTEEFYRRVSGRLSKGGVFGQWLHLYEINDSLVAGVLAAIDRVFPSYDVFLTSDSDILVMASNAATLPRPDWSVVNDSGLAEDLRRVVPITPEQFDAMRLGTRALLHPYLVARAKPNSDFYPSLDLGTERTRFNKEFASGFLDLGEARFDLTAAVTAASRGLATAFAIPTPEIARVRGMATSARMRAGQLVPPVYAVPQSDSELQAAAYRYAEFSRTLASGAAPTDWRLWTGELVGVEHDLHDGAAGIADEAFYAEVRRYLDRAPHAPDEARATLAFLHGLAAWNFSEAAYAADILVAARVRGEVWIPSDLLRDGAVLADIMTSRFKTAGGVFTSTGHRTTDEPATLTDDVLESLLFARERAALAPGAAGPTTPGAKTSAPRAGR